MAGRKKANVETVLYDMDLSHNHLFFGKTDDPKKYVPIILERLRTREGDDFAELIASIKSAFPEEYEQEKENFTLENPEFVAALFKAATSLNIKDKARHRAIALAFNKGNLNIQNPLHWRVLIETFCWTHFGENYKAGKPPTWTDEKYCQLLGDIHRVKTEMHTDEDKRACVEVLKRYGRSYNSISLGRLQRALREARDMNYNQALVTPVYETAIKESDSRSAASKVKEKAYLKQLSKEHADRIGTEWAFWRKTSKS